MTVSYTHLDVYKRQVYDEIDPKITSTFAGYDHLEHNSKISVLTTDTEVTEAISDGEHGTIFVDETPFYATKMCIRDRPDVHLRGRYQEIPGK